MVYFAEKDSVYEQRDVFFFFRNFINNRLKYRLLYIFQSHFHGPDTDFSGPSLTQRACHLSLFLRAKAHIYGDGPILLVTEKCKLLGNQERVCSLKDRLVGDLFLIKC